MGTGGGGAVNRGLKTAGPKSSIDAKRLSSYTTRKQGSGYQGSSNDLRSYQQMQGGSTYQVAGFST